MLEKVRNGAAFATVRGIRLGRCAANRYCTVSGFALEFRAPHLDPRGFPGRRKSPANRPRLQTPRRPCYSVYFFSGAPPGGVVVAVAAVGVAAPAVPGVGNGNVLNIDFAWVCICSCICTNMFFDCSI